MSVTLSHQQVKALQRRIDSPSPLWYRTGPRDGLDSLRGRRRLQNRCKLLCSSQIKESPRSMTWALLLGMASLQAWRLFTAAADTGFACLVWFQIVKMAATCLKKMLGILLHL